MQQADLSKPETIPATLVGVHTVIDCATGRPEEPIKKVSFCVVVVSFVRTRGKHGFHLIIGRDIHASNIMAFCLCLLSFQLQVVCFSLSPVNLSIMVSLSKVFERLILLCVCVCVYSI